MPAPSLRLNTEEEAALQGEAGPAVALSYRLVTAAARFLGAQELVPIRSAHIDGCLYHGDGGVEFAERLVASDARVLVPTTLNVGALDLLTPRHVRAAPERLTGARRLMDAYVAMGCLPTWTCAPYQVGHRPQLGEHVAWGESNAVAFVNSVLGARSERYGDFLDIACALAGRAPYFGLHRPENRRASLLVDLSKISQRLRESDVFYPVLGTWLGLVAEGDVAVLAGLPADTSEDRLKALGAAAASSGAVALFHVAGRTPEAPDLESALQGRRPRRTLRPTPSELRVARDRLSTASGQGIDAVALGSPHFSVQEFNALESLLRGRRTRVPFYVCSGRDTLAEIEATGVAESLRHAGLELVADTCVVVTPILAAAGGVLMTNSGKFAHYGPSTTGYDVIYGSLEDCVASAEKGSLVRDEAVWQ